MNEMVSGAFTFSCMKNVTVELLKYKTLYRTLGYDNTLSSNDTL